MSQSSGPSCKATPACETKTACCKRPRPRKRPSFASSPSAPWPATTAHRSCGDCTRPRPPARVRSNGNGDKLLEVVRTEKDPKVRADAMRALVSQKSGITGENMVSLYNAEQDTQIKMSIVDGLY